MSSEEEKKGKNNSFIRLGLKFTFTKTNDLR